MCQMFNFVFKSRMRPKLPYAIEQMLPAEVLHNIYQYVPHVKKESPKHSPTLQKDLYKIQNSPLRGKSSNFMRDLEEFCLD